MAERRLGIGRRSGGGKIDVKIALQSQYRIGFNFTIMTSLKDARDLLFLSFGQGLIDEADFLILYDINSSGNLSYPYEKYGMLRCSGGRVVSTSVSHQCGPGSIPGWGSDPGAVSEKGLSSPV